MLERYAKILKANYNKKEPAFSLGNGIRIRRKNIKDVLSLWGLIKTSNHRGANLLAFLVKGAHIHPAATIAASCLIKPEKITLVPH